MDSTCMNWFDIEFCEQLSARSPSYRSDYLSSGTAANDRRVRDLLRAVVRSQPTVQSRVLSSGTATNDRRVCVLLRAVVRSHRAEYCPQIPLRMIVVECCPQPASLAMFVPVVVVRQVFQTLQRQLPSASYQYLALSFSCLDLTADTCCEFNTSTPLSQCETVDLVTDNCCQFASRSHESLTVPLFLGVKAVDLFLGLFLVRTSTSTCRLFSRLINSSLHICRTLCK